MSQYKAHLGDRAHLGDGAHIDVGAHLGDGDNLVAGDNLVDRSRVGQANRPQVELIQILSLAWIKVIFGLSRGYLFVDGTFLFDF